MTVVYVLLVAHFVGDFICQSDWMALNKSKRWDALALHVGAYSGVLFGFVNWALWMRAGFGPPPLVLPVLIYVGWNAAAHFVQDAITSRITSRLWFFRMETGIYKEVEYVVPKRGIELINPWMLEGGDRHWFFVAIGADQLLHYVTLFVTAGWWLT